MASFTVKFLGCKVSQYDSERIAEWLKKFGLKEDSENPDLYILNGCSVTGRASQKVRQTFRAAKRKWPNAKMVLAGCEARLRDQRTIDTPEADWILLHGEFEQLVKEMLDGLKIPYFKEITHIANNTPLSSRTRAFLKIQDGCNQFCSYCIVAHLRGEEWSAPIADAVAEAKKLVKEGHKEIILTGIHIGHFKPGLVELLTELEKIDGLERLRISSIESVEVRDELIDWVANSPKACNHFHLPLQSGCDAILKEMRRPYNTDEFRTIVQKIRSKLPDVAISTDLIVGFPGETEQNFAETLEFLKEMEFSRIHIFRYSKRDGTPAASMPNQLSNKVKHERSNMVEEVWKNSAQAYHSKFLDREVEVIWETQKDGIWHGTSREYVPCFIKDSSTNLENKICKVIGQRVTEEGLFVSLSGE